MNNYTAAIGSFIRYDMIIFNTLEYTMKKDKYDVAAYKARKEIIRNELDQNTPLHACLENSGEAGANLTKRINELLDVVYGNDSTILKLSQNGSELHVDYSQCVTVFEHVLPIHEELRKIIEAHMNGARKDDKMDEPSYVDLISKNEYFYRGMVNMLLLDQFDHLFAEYNKARNEAKGAITPQSNFIQNDISRVVNLFHFVRNNAVARSADYYEVIDPLFALIEMTGGRRDLPEGKNFGDVFTNVKQITREHANKWEIAWKPVYDNFNKHFQEEIQKMQANAKQA